MLQAKDIRQKFIQYFEEAGHTHVRSASLVPYNDPTLLFTNAGMNQFKDVFLGIDKRPYQRATTSQKCVRAGGKHNDLETVGKTARHHTFFEMLGNFSFGDYFKKEAIHYAWVFLTQELGLSPENLWITVYLDDDEAYDLWQAETGFPDERILRLDEKDNFWQMGDVGPCGPCSEIHFDRGSEYACDHKDGCALGVCDCDRWLEIWNLVFMQYNRDETGQLTPLPKPSVDTGMGLERITSVIQGLDNNWDTDLFVPLLQYVEVLSGKPYHKDKRGFPFRVIADHARACTFLIADGVMPSNEGRGYVLRRILRRAVRLGKSIGLDEPFLYRFTEKVCALMGDVYPEIVEQKAFIEGVIRGEEERFLQTLQDGLKRVNETISDLKKNHQTCIDGNAAFMFYDTYGFPIDLTKDMAEEEGMTVDVEGFEAAMARQKQQSKDARNQVNVWDLAKTISDQYPQLGATVFTGYDRLEEESLVQGLLVDGQAQSFGYDVSANLLVDRTPFYAQGGGQVGDRGKCYGKNGVFQVENTIKLPDGKYVLEGYVDGRIEVGETLRSEVDAENRQATARNHTATHLLHHALRDILGEDVHQAGSLVDAEHLRFDFSFPQAMSIEQIKSVESAVNAAILTGGAVVTRHLNIDEAKEEGYVALFGEKYDDVVRCIAAGAESKELCGGTHVSQVSEIGLFKIVSEGAVSAGIRRIEAVTGLNAYAYVTEKADLLREGLHFLKATRDEEFMPRLQQLDQENRQLKKALEQIKQEQMRGALKDKIKNVIDLDGFQILVDRVQASNTDELRKMADQYRDRLKKGIVVLGSPTEDGKVMLVSMVTQDEAKNILHAGKIIKAVAAYVGGKGGGRPDMAQAGGSDVEKLQEALSRVKDIVQEQLKER